MMDDRDIELCVVTGDVMNRVLRCAGQMTDMFETGKTINRKGQRIFYVFDRVHSSVLFEGDGDLTFFSWLLSVKELILGEHGYTREDVPWDGHWKDLLIWLEGYAFGGDIPLLKKKMTEKTFGDLVEFLKKE